jgi:hypothetical protein
MNKFTPKAFLSLFALLGFLPTCSSTASSQLDAAGQLDTAPPPDTATTLDGPVAPAPDTAVVSERRDARRADTQAPVVPDTGTTTPRDTLPPDTNVVKNPNGCTASDDIQFIGNKIMDMSGTRFVARGPEIIVASAGISSAIDAIAATGANAARFLLTLDEANGMTPERFDTLMARAVSKNLILWVSLYSWNNDKGNPISAALGGGNFYSLTAPAGTGTCSSSRPASCYLAVWSRDWLKNLVQKYKGHIILDAMQEYIGPSNMESEQARSDWAEAAKTNIKWFRSAGFTNPLEVMTSFQGRDLYAIVQKGESIRAADTHTVSGYPQTMFGWQAYWASDYYKTFQGSLLLGKSNGSITAAEAITQFVMTQAFPIQVGFDAFNPDTGAEYKEQVIQSAKDQSHWLWWVWEDNGVACTNHPECADTVVKSTDGFAGAVKSTCPL